jgi:YgiT-type zinc finger domain-containing protein
MKPPRETYDYGECEICDARLKDRLIRQDFWIHGELIVVENVPAGVCPQCGAKVVNAEVGEQIAKSPRISVPLLHYQPTE